MPAAYAAPSVGDFSVALCTYNGERFVAEQLRSIIGQTAPPAEIVVVDDASDDRTAEIVRMIADQTSVPFRIVRHNQNVGAVASFEEAIALARSPLVALADQDDVWVPEKLAALSTAFDSPRVRLACTDAELIDSGGESLGVGLWAAVGLRAGLTRKPIGGLLRELRRNYVTGATIAFRSELAAIALPVPRVHAVMHDFWLAVVAAATDSIALVDRPLVRYRIHSAQQVGLTGVTAGTDEPAIPFPDDAKEQLLTELAVRLHGRYRRRVIRDLEFLRFRVDPPTRRRRRLLAVTRHYARGRYREHDGLPAALRDIVHRRPRFER